jgi:hypothetical protein|tara:strand:+ start:65 stop:358 length:294 start_codon:yes stop_codon:yes gene_type:complete
MVNTVQNITAKVKIRGRKSFIMPNIEIIRDTKAPPRVTAPQSFYRDLVGSMKAGDWFVLEEQDRNRVQAGIIKYARGRYSLYQNPLQENSYIFTITK